jgi:hypothetical protein
MQYPTNYFLSQLLKTRSVKINIKGENKDPTGIIPAMKPKIKSSRGKGATAKNY